MKRRQARRPNGRFRRNRLSDLGLRAPVCAACRGFNTVNVGEANPETCCQCGAQFVELDLETGKPVEQTKTKTNEPCAKYGCHRRPRGGTIYCREHHEPWCQALKFLRPDPDDCDCHQPQETP